MPKFIKTNERLPDKEGEYFIKFKTDVEFIVKDVKYFWLDGDEEDKQEVRDFWENTIEEWLDESEDNNSIKLSDVKDKIDNYFDNITSEELINRLSKEEITDTIRLDWLEKNSNKIDWEGYNQEFNTWKIRTNTTLREYIDKQLKQK